MAEASALESGKFEELEVNIKAIWSVIFRNRYLIATSLAVCVMAALAITLLTTPTYQASTSIQIEQQSTKVLEAEDVQPIAAPQDTERFLQTQLDILQSRSLAERVADSLGLWKSNDFLQRMDASTDDDAGATDKNALREIVVSLLQGNMSVDLGRNSRVAAIMFESSDPTLAAKVANSYAQNYITGNLSRRFEASSYARNFLEEQLAATREKLEVSERSLIAYARSAGLIEASSPGATGESSQSLTSTSLGQLNEAYSTAQAARLAAQGRWTQAEASSPSSLPEVLSNSAIQQLTQKRAELRASYQQQRQRRKADHPELLQAAAEIAEIDTQITQLSAHVRDSLRQQYLAAQRQEDALASQVSSLKSATLAEKDRSVQYNILKREVDTNRALYDGLLQRFKEVSAAAGITTNNISVIDRAEVPTSPVAPMMSTNLALGIVAGLGLGLLIAFAREKLDDAIRSPEDVDTKLGVPFLASAPLLDAGQNPSEALADPRSPLSEAYHTLRATLMVSSATGLPRSILLTSSRPAEGKSTTSYAIARDFARIGKSVLLIDADLRKPSLHRTLALSNNAGITNLLAQQVAVSDVTQQTSTRGLSFISCGPLPPNPAELLGGPALESLLREMSKQFDLVVIDGPPVLGLADATVLAAASEATVFVIEANGSHRGQAKVAIRRLRIAGARILGAVLTKFDARQLGYGSDYGYSYSYDYGTKKKDDAITA